MYIGDIGDNGGRREFVTVYRVAEPSPRDASTAPAEVFHASYPNGAHDAEALFVTGESDVFLITKGDPGPVALYHFPKPLRAPMRMLLERVASPPHEGERDPDSRDRPTGADATPDGRWVAVRTTHWIAFHRTADLVSGRWTEVFRADVTALREYRGEGIALTGSETAFLVGEGGLGADAGTFADIGCTLPR